MKGQEPKISFFFKKNNRVAHGWVNKIRELIRKSYPRVLFVNENPDTLIVLGGDGTILEAARKYHHKSNPAILGLNLGNVGFLASTRSTKDFMRDIKKFLSGKFSVLERLILSAEVLRNGKIIFSTEVLNEIVAQSILGMVELEVAVNKTSIRNIRGSGVLISTATGSTAYNLSAHGPIVMPNIKCLIITELMDHDVPVPSIVIKYNEEVEIKIKNFREKGILSISKNGKKADVVLITDGDKVFQLQRGDIIKIKSSSHLVKFIEFEKNYFFKSLKDKFSVR